MSAEERNSNPLFNLPSCSLGREGQEGSADSALLQGGGPTIEIRLNGEPKEVNLETLQELLLHLRLLDKPVAVERNREIIFKEQYQNTRLVAGDAIEIIQFVGGG